MSKNQQELTIKDLVAQVESLTAKVKKQSQVITQTGQQVLEIQLAAQKQKIQDIPDPQAILNGGAGNLKQVEAIEEADYATNEDIFQLVGELQGQLDFLEERSIRRGINLTKTNANDLLAPLPDSDGAEPENFPKTLAEFKELNDKKIVELCGFYQILPPSDEQKQQFEDFLADKVKELNIEEQGYEDFGRFGKEEIINLFNSLARYVGVSCRKGDNQW
ncbi:Mrp8 protein [Saccharomycopsis crataegensis]|uniref:Mrp8 protein n=1 Tax=Saccharomycopsis crataegensis TaxID=43959 RepID=A0AAV5QDL2_9ASCO|nr:Mrp8 protein [Saccharomycopsis crataegensis]